MYITKGKIFNFLNGATGGFDSDLKKKKWNLLQEKKEKNTKTNKITIVKNQNLATQNFPFNMHIHFPFGNI
jgi:hypothetical protein